MVNENVMTTIGNNEKNFCMQDLVNIVGKNAVNVDAITMNVSNMSKQMGVLATEVNSMRSDLSAVVSDVENLKLNEEITTDQAAVITRAAKLRICEILGDTSSLDYKKYSKIFFKRLYGDTRACAGLGSSIYRTHKGNYQNVVNYIEAWNPKGGCAALKEKADVSAKNRRQAIETGYAC